MVPSARNLSDPPRWVHSPDVSEWPHSFPVNSSNRLRRPYAQVTLSWPMLFDVPRKTIRLWASALSTRLTTYAVVCAPGVLPDATGGA